MKPFSSAIGRTLRTLVAGLCAWALFAAQASDTTATERAQAKAKPIPSRAQVKKTPATPLTGSHLPQQVRRHGSITDGARQVVVLDRKAIEQSGASSIPELLRRRGTSR